MFRQHRATRIVFEVDYKFYKPVAPELFSSLPNGPPQVLPLDYPDRSLNDLGDNMLEYLGGNGRNGIEVVNVERTIPEVDEEGESVQMFESPLMELTCFDSSMPRASKKQSKGKGTSTSGSSVGVRNPDYVARVENNLGRGLLNERCIDLNNLIVSTIPQ
ncbi:hypothetical protein LWI29_000866 [Acer saccharum]|uniref:Uncharacterized protein n=1 Tax=Acer saccharum TaxID=4024 RepID=A0AA39VM88_ACESA|nr:hypothetical protein LWI29_000866 [Acer saccharum]